MIFRHTKVGKIARACHAKVSVNWKWPGQLSYFFYFKRKKKRKQEKKERMIFLLSFISFSPWMNSCIPHIDIECQRYVLEQLHVEFSPDSRCIIFLFQFNWRLQGYYNDFTWLLSRNCPYLVRSVKYVFFLRIDQLNMFFRQGKILDQLNMFS